MDETQATTTPEDVNGWTLENDLGPTTVYQAGDIQVKKYTHIAENHNMGTFSLQITNGMRSEKIATDDDEDVVLSALLHFVDEHGPQDARAVLDGDLEVDYGLEDTDDQDDDEDDEDDGVDLSRPVTAESVKGELDVHGIGARAFGNKDLFETWHDVVSYWAGVDGDFTGLEGVGKATSEKLDAAVRDRLVPEIGRPDGSPSESSTFKETRPDPDEQDDEVKVGYAVRELTGDDFDAGDVVRTPEGEERVVVETGAEGMFSTEDGGRDDLVGVVPEESDTSDSTLWAPEKLDVVEKHAVDVDQDDEDDVDAPDTFALLACSSLKAADEDDDVDEDDELPAREIYRGSLFKKTREHAERTDTPYAILSGKYGVLEPDDEISDYDVSVRSRDTDEWVDQVVDGLETLPLDDVDEIQVFAGKAYREPLAEYLESLDADVSVPVEGASGIGDMLSMMNDLLDDLDDDQDGDDVLEQDDAPDDAPDDVGDWSLTNESPLVYAGRADFESSPWVQVADVREDDQVVVRGAGDTEETVVADDVDADEARDALLEYLETTSPDVARVAIDPDDSLTGDETDVSDEQDDATDDTDQRRSPSPDAEERAEKLESLGLSGREAEVTALKEQGLTHAEIAGEIDSSKSTVDEYSRRAGKKLEKARKLAESVDLY